MHKNPFVSVVMVTYNSSSYVALAIDSILNSSFRNFELIISDDNSSDDTWEIILSFNDTRIKSIRNKINLGEYPNREQCIEMAKGDYLIFIDGDDIIYPHGLEFMTKMLNAFPDCGMALMIWFRNNVILPSVVTPYQFYIGEYFGNGFLGTAFSNVLFKVEVLKKQGKFLEKYKAGDDYIRYKIALNNNSLLINDGLTWWRETPNQASSKLKESGQQLIENFEMKLDFINYENCPLSKIEKKLALSNINLIITKEIFRNLKKGKINLALKIYRNFKIPFHFFLTPFKKIIEIDPFSNYSPSKPFYFPFNNNPYSPNEYNK